MSPSSGPTLAAWSFWGLGGGTPDLDQAGGGAPYVYLHRRGRVTIPSHVNRRTDATENITFPRTTHVVGGEDQKHKPEEM